jgi:hypothetical protein
MQKSFKATILALGALFFASSLVLSAQTAPPPAPDAGPPPQHQAKTAKGKRPAGKKGARKKARNKKKTAER